MPSEETFLHTTEVHRRYQNNTYVTGCIVGQTCWWVLERGWRSRIVRCMDRLHGIHFIEWKATWRIYMVRGGLTWKQTTSRPDNIWPDMWKHVSDASKRKEKQKKSAIEKLKHDNARRLRGIYFIYPADEEFKNIMKNVRGKLKLRCQQQCFVKLHCAEVAGKLAAPLEDTRQNTHVLLKLTILWESEWKEVLTDIMKIILQEKGRIH